LARLLRSEGLRSILRRARSHRRRARELRSRWRLDLGGLRPGEPRERLEGPVADIVVPVYGAADETRACLESVLRHTELERHRLIVVDDGNDQPELLRFLSELAAGARRRGLSVEVLRSPVNRGFTGAANLGFRASHLERPVVLLNSDTQVAAGWLEGLLSGVRDSGTASVTPLSNRATICTVPFAAGGSARPEAHAIEEHAGLVARCSFHEAPTIPTPVGFCVLLTRRAISEVGFFDEAAFPRGYGEENDWGWRAHRKGLCHRLADSVFVYHEGARSFGASERRQRMRAGARVLEQRYPTHREAVAAHLAVDPLRRQRSVIEMLESDAFSRRPGVLHLTGGDPAQPRGGVDHHVAELRDGLVDLGWSPSVAWKEGSELRVLWGTAPEKEWSIRIGDGSASERSAREAQVLRYVLRALGVQVVQIHDATALERSALLELDARVVVTLHDFQLFCRRPHLIDSQTGNFCGYSTDAVRCGRCLAGAAGFPEQGDTNQEAWRLDSARLVDRADAIVAPSLFMADALCDLFPVREREKRLHVIEHGRSTQIPRPRRSHARPLRVVFLGQFHEIKGSRVYSSIVRELVADPRFRFAIVGGIVDHQALDAMRRVARVETVGWYERGSVEELLEPGSDVVVFTSLAPESSSYTSSEALSTGVPVLAFDRGAVAERLRRIGAASFLVSCAGDFVERLRELAEGKLSWPADAAEPEWTPAQEAEQYAALYSALVDGVATTVRR
jgi:GT2 family glycosyltransferase/glycosyltransferase involved in cell wall biosynthesis